VEYPSFNSVMLSKKWSVVGEIIFRPFRSDHRVTDVADGNPGDDRLKFDIARVGGVVNIAIIASPDVPKDAGVAFPALRTDYTSPERS
jgi:hypothetical protein